MSYNIFTFSPKSRGVYKFKFELFTEFIFFGIIQNSYLFIFKLELFFQDLKIKIFIDRNVNNRKL
jgi:hypothetical protein